MGILTHIGAAIVGAIIGVIVMAAMAMASHADDEMEKHFNSIQEE